MAAEFAVLFPAAIELATAALLLALVVGLTLGIAAALKRGSWFDQLVMGLATMGNSMSVFLWGLVLIMFFSVDLQWTPVSGRVGIEFDVDPVTSFMLIGSAMLEVLREDCMRTARAKGRSPASSAGRASASG